MELLAKSTLPDYAKQYVNSLIEKGRLPSTIKRYVYDLEDFFNWLRLEKNNVEMSTWKNLTADDIHKFMDVLKAERNYAASTTKRVLSVLNQLYRFFEKKGIININPINDVSIPIVEHMALNKKELITSEEQEKLLTSIASSDGLTENQQKSRPYLIHRNKSIIHLFLFYGLSLQELVHLNMHHIHFETNTIDVPSTSSEPRTIKIENNDKKLFYTYYKTVPKAVRPRYHSHDPFFVAFDFQRNTFRWLYELDQPKRLTEIAIQKMIRQEVKRAGLRKGISAQHFRNTFAIQMLLKGTCIDTIQNILGLKHPTSLKRYIDYVDQMELET